MPSKLSLYRKIQEVLAVARSHRPNSIEELVEIVMANPADMFRTMQYDPKRDEMTSQVSLRVIRATINMCTYLELIDTSMDREGRLTAIGREAVRRTRFDAVVAARIRSRMKESGVSLVKINQQISECLKSSPPVLPTARALWETWVGELGRGRFNRLLTLLAYCGDAESSQNKIYLHIATR